MNGERYKSVYPRDSWSRRIVQMAGVLSALIALVTVIEIIDLIYHWGDLRSCALDPDRKLQRLIGFTALWAIAPPIWFWCEYFYLYRPHAQKPGEDLEFFKTGQDNAKAIWAAFVLVLGGLTTAVSGLADECQKPKIEKAAQILEQDVPEVIANPS